MEDKRVFFSRLVANPQLVKSEQERLSEICNSYPWFAMARAIRIPLINGDKRKREYINKLSLNLYSNNYYKMQMGEVKTTYTEEYLFSENLAEYKKNKKNKNIFSDDNTSNLIDSFLSISATKFSPQNTDNKSVSNNKTDSDDGEIVTETMAKIYEKQALYSEAISVYRKLSLKNPEKSRYFAGIISSLEEKLIEK